MKQTQNTHKNSGLMIALGIGLSMSAASAFEIESVEVENGQMKLKVKTPPVEIERMNADGSFTKETESTAEQNTVDITVPADQPKKLVRARMTVGDEDVSSPVVDFVPRNQVLDPRRARPQSVGVAGEQLQMTLPQLPGDGQGPKFPNGFPLFLPEGPLQMSPNATGGYTGTLPNNAGSTFRTELTAYMNRLRSLGTGKVPVFMGRQLTGYMTVPNPTTLGPNVELFPFVNGGSFEALTVPGAPILGFPGAVDPQKSLMVTNLSVEIGRAHV